MQKLFFNHLLLPEGWGRDVALALSGEGNVASLEPGSTHHDCERFVIGIPGFLNAHSHAFQRAMAGLAEFRVGDRDTFWTWRDVMYRFARAVTPDDQRAISAHLQVELLKHGFTSLAEFHYLHHQADGTPYSSAAAMSLATMEAARASGVGLTHLPTLYMTAGFGAEPLGERQIRFGNSVQSLLDIARATPSAPDIAIGVAAHSLRAVPESALRELAAAMKNRPFHIHIAEQTGEVDDCLRHRGQRPVNWLLDHMEVTDSWTLVHATHMDQEETKRLARSGATAAICPTTEGNLGDGIFPLPEFIANGGQIGIGTDSHVSVTPWEELRWLEYVQRLVHRARNLAATDDSPHSGTALVRHVCESAAAVSGRKIGRLAMGWRADVVVLDERLPQFEGRSPDQILNSAIFGGVGNPVRHVMAGGRWIVRDGRHFQEENFAAEYRETLKRLTDQL